MPKVRQVGSREHRPEGTKHRSTNDFDEQLVPVNGGAGWPLDKSLCLIPETFRFALVYGVNPHTGRQTPRWRARNVVRWCRPNPPVGALGDKFRPATTELVVACAGRSRYFDLDAVRGPWARDYTDETPGGEREFDRNGKHRVNTERGAVANPAGAPPLDWWEIPTAPYPGAHYATWPEQLLVRPIEAMCPRRVCTVCGRPSERVTGEPEYIALRQAFREGQQWGDERVGMSGSKAPASRVAETVSWTDCGHDAWRPGVTLDPFAGTGTTLAVAFGHGRSSIGVDVDDRNAWLARERVGMWLNVELPPTVVDVPVGDVL